MSQPVVCRTSYTPAEMIAALSLNFVTGNLRPGISPDGKPVYPLKGKDEKVEVSSGCAVYTLSLATANADLVRDLDRVSTHSSCKARDLHSNGIRANSLLNPVGTSLHRRCPNHPGQEHINEYCGEYSNANEAISAFLQALQDAHDTAALQYHHETTSLKMADEVALINFRDRFNAELTKVAVAYKIPESDITAALSSMQPSLSNVSTTPTLSFSKSEALVPVPTH